MSELNSGLSPEVELEMGVVDVNPTLEMQMQVEIGGRASELNAEAWAVGERNGVPVSTTDQTYQNNARYYAEHAESIIEAATEAAIAEATEDAEDAAEDAEAWAKGTRGGTEVGSSDPTYHNNSEYYAGVAQTAAASASAAYGTDLLAPDYDSTETYAVGDHVIYSGDYYICNTAITTAEAWTAAHWTQETVSGELTSQKADIEELESSKADAIEVTDSTPASVMSFSDGGDGYPLSATFEIAPVQDLHGQANPWPGGGNKNILNPSAVTLGVRLGSSGQETVDESYYASEYIPVTVGTSYAKNSPSVDAYHRFAVYDSSKVFVRAVGSSNTLTIANGESFIRMCGLQTELPTTQVEVGSASTPFVPYSNLCPITGWTGCKPSRTGKNLFDGTREAGYIDDNGVVGTDGYNRHSDYIKVNEGSTYTYSCTSYYNANSVNRRVHAYDKNKNWIEMITKNTQSGTGEKSCTFTVPSGCEFIRVQIYRTESDSTGDKNVQIEEGSTATTYEAFGTTLNISFPAGAGTVYGGTLTVNKDGTGKLVVDRATESIDGTETFIGTATSVGALYASDDKFNKFKTSTTGVDLCDTYPAVTAANTSAMADKTIARQNTTNSRLFIKDSQFANMTDTQLATYFTSHPVQYCGKLITPVEYDLTATEVGQILSLLGTNNLFCDTGDVLSVDYSADTKTYVDTADEINSTHISSIFGMIAERDGKTATTNHPVGDVFAVQTYIGVYTNTLLVRATSAIASGETITVGTNCETLTLAEYIAEKATATAVQNSFSMLEEKTLALGLTPMNRAVFPNYQKGVQTGTSTNLRYVDVLFNTVRSEGRNLSGTTYRGIFLTSNGVVNPGQRLDQTPTLYRSYFKAIPRPINADATYKLVIRRCSYIDDAYGSGSNEPQTILFTYDGNDDVTKTSFVSWHGEAGTSYKAYRDVYYILPDDFMTNGNICIGVNFRTPKATIEAKYELMYIETKFIPEDTIVLEAVTTTIVVQDDPTT